MRDARFGCSEQIDRHAALIELKYLKATDDASPEALAKIKGDAATQLEKYAADRDLARLWHLKSRSDSNIQTFKHSNILPPVKLTCLAIVFHGTELALCEELP